MEKQQIKELAKMICNYCEEGGELPEPQELEEVINDFITKEQEPNILYLKWGNINGWDSMPVDLESYKLIRELEERCPPPPVPTRFPWTGNQPPTKPSSAP